MDPDGGPVTLDVAGVGHDEPGPGRGTLHVCPDAIVDQGRLLLRAERRRGGDGRTYRIDVVGSDQHGGRCVGLATVCIPAGATSEACGGAGPTVDATQPACTGRCAALCTVEVALGDVSCPDGDLPPPVLRRLAKARRLLEVAAGGAAGSQADSRAARAVRRLDRMRRALDRGRGRKLGPGCQAAVRAALERSLAALADVGFEGRRPSFEVP